MPSESILVLFIFLGAVSGLLGGLLGIGGGVVTVPVFYFIFQNSPILEDKAMQVAASTSLAVGFLTSLMATYIQVRKKAISNLLVKLLLPGLFLGCILGSVIGHSVSSTLLTYFFGVTACFLGIYFCFPSLPSLHISASPNRGLSLFGVIIGLFSSLLGIGGGSLTFPILLGYHVPVKNASANSSAATTLTTLFGTIGYLFAAWSEPELALTVGYIEIPALITTGLVSMLMAPVGARLSHTLDTKLIKRIFGCCLSLVGLSMLLL